MAEPETLEHRLIVPDGAMRERADRVLARHFPQHSRSALQRAFDAGLVLLGDDPIARDETLEAGDEVTFRMPDTRPSLLIPANIPLAILYEDDAMVVVDKAAGMVVHPGAGTGGDTLVHALLHHCAGRLSGIGGEERPGIVHRLDRETSGVIVAARTDQAHRELARQFAMRETTKEYLLLVAGVPALKSGIIDRPIGRHPVHRQKMAVLSAGGRTARTDWVLERDLGGRAALLRCRIHTGRTHQIRVHMQSLGHPLLGDAVYGGTRAGAPAASRVMLHSARLGLTHPESGRALVFEAPLPEDFQSLIKTLERNRL